MNYPALTNLENILPGKKRLALGISVVSSLILFYIYNDRKKKSTETDGEHETIIKGKQTIVEVKVPSDCARNIIGPGGQNIKELQKRTNTRMNFKDKLNQNETDKSNFEWNPENAENNPKDQERTLIIRGSNTNVQRAEFEIKKLILENPISMTQEFYVPQYACGRIIGKGGSTIREMSQASNCKISVIDDKRLNKFDSSQSIEKLSEIAKDSSDQTFRVIRITGSNERISYAKELIVTKVKEEESFREKRTRKYRY